jgi:phage shock protein PspC (stress-responsive transcriptional regulator)
MKAQALTCCFNQFFLFCVIMSRFKDFIEWQAFGVCTAIGDRLGIATSRIRTWFIYISFLTMGSPLIVYFILAFLLNIKRYIGLAKRNPLNS